MRRLRQLGLLVGSLMMLMVCVLALGPESEAAFPGQNGKIAFVSSRDGNNEIYVMNADGTGLQNMTQNAANDYEPAWSPDGGQLLFTSRRAGDDRIFEMPGFGGEATPRSFLSGTRLETSPTKAPNGRVAFETNLHGGYEIYSQDATGEARRLTENDPISDRAPVFSPDGAQIAFWSTRAGTGRDIFVMNNNGTNVRQLTNYSDSDRDPAWSPDGTKIAFERNLGSNSDLFVMNADGTNQVNLTNNPADDRYGAWSPDGTKIAFRSSRDGNSEIYVMDANGANVKRLTNNVASDEDPDWQPQSQDSDGDALLDDWESKGYDHDKDGKIDVDLPKMGADPRHKDVFVEVDKMVHHPMYPEAVATVVAAFARSPVSNPDGKSGITLHVDNGSGSIMNPKTGARWGSLGRSNPLAHADVLGNEVNGRYEWGEFDELKKRNFSQERAQTFHYAVTAHRMSAGPDPSSGVSRGIVEGMVGPTAAGSDMVLAPGTLCRAIEEADCAGSIDQQAGNFMHELGHNLGLDHGGLDQINNKPNYLSVMNYSFSSTGLAKSNGGWVFDYSRFSPTGTPGATNTLATLVESNLDEAAGFGAVGADVLSFSTTIFCPNRAEQPHLIQGAVSWDCDRNDRERGIEADINGDGVRGQTLATFNDWPFLRFGGGAIGANGPSRTLPRSTPGGDARRAELLKAARVLLRDAKAPKIVLRGSHSGRAGRATLVYITARDNKALGVLMVGIDRRWFEFPVRGRKKVFATRATVLRAGVRTIRAVATDRAGNRSRLMKFTVRIRRR